MTPQLLHGWIVNWGNQSRLTSHVELFKASRPKVILPLALPLRTLMPSCIFCFQDVSTARWFPVISGSPFWTYSFLFLILQACYCHRTFPCYFCIFWVSQERNHWCYMIFLDLALSMMPTCQISKYLHKFPGSLRFPTRQTPSTVLACHPMEWLTPR